MIGISSTVEIIILIQLFLDNNFSFVGISQYSFCVALRSDLSTKLKFEIRTKISTFKFAIIAGILVKFSV